MCYSNYFFFLAVVFPREVFAAAAFRRAAHRAFIICESLRRPAAVIPPRCFFGGVTRGRGAEALLRTLPCNA